MLFMESGGNTEPARPSAIPALQDPQRDSGGSWDEVRQPIAPTRDVLMGDIYDNFGDDMSDQFDNDPFGRGAFTISKKRSLMFHARCRQR